MTSPKQDQANTFSDGFRTMSRLIEQLTPNHQRPNLRPIPVAEKCNLRALGKLLLNAWSAEYALRITPVVNDEQYLQSSLHWTFPQAYYSAYFSARAFLMVQGFEHSREELVGRRLAHLVMLGHYPASLGYYLTSEPGNFRYNRMADGSLKWFLETTRRAGFMRAKKALQYNPKTALRRPINGAPLTVFSREQYKSLTKDVGVTTFFDLMKRLRISSTDRDLESLVDTKMDVKTFHKDLKVIAYQLNLVHEGYIMQAIGQKAYAEIVRNAPSYLATGFALDRLNTLTQTPSHEKPKN